MRPVIKWINARSIKTKMLAGFASVLIILLGVAGSGYLRFLGVETSFKDYAQRVDVVAISYDIDRELFNRLGHRSDGEGGEEGATQ